MTQWACTDTIPCSMSCSVARSRAARCLPGAEKLALRSIALRDEIGEMLLGSDPRYRAMLHWHR